jgi:hypothetical protein
MTSKNKHTIHDIPSEYYIVALMATVAYFIVYVWFPFTPGNVEKHFIGWFGWADQGAYLMSTKAIAQLDFSPAKHIYPLGYPLLGVPFIKWLPRHPYLIPNLIFSVGIVIAFYAACRKILTKTESISLTFFFIILSGFTSSKVRPGGLIWTTSLIIPWNLIPVFFAAYMAVWLLIFNTADFHKLWFVSFCIALAFFARPPDVVFLGIIYLAGLIDLKSLKEKVRGVMILAFSCFVVLVINLALRWVIYGSVISPYDINTSNQGFSLYDFPFRLYQAFFHGTPISGYKELLLFSQMPWLLLCIPGIMVLAKYTHAKSWFLIASIITCVVLYISYNPMSPSVLMYYFGYRYLIWVFPWLGLCAYLTLTRSFSEIGKRKTIAGVAVAALFVLVIGVKETNTAIISTSPDQDTGRISQFYNADTRQFISNIYLPVPIHADGIRLVFSTLPSKNMDTAVLWANFNLIIDGEEESLYRDYNLWQSGQNVYVPFRKPINQSGQLQKVRIQYDDTDDAVLEKVYFVKKEFQLFGFTKGIIRRLLRLTQL